MHKSVLVGEAIKAFGLENAPLNYQAKRRLNIIDATLGAGGHTVELIKRGAYVLGIEQDPLMLNLAKKKIESACPASHNKFGKLYDLHLGNFRNIDEIVKNTGIENISGVLFDLGVSTDQLTSKKRGFSFTERKAPLDMRMNKDIQSVKASDLLNSLSKNNLQDMFSETLNYKESADLADKIVERRQTLLFQNVGDFLDVISNSLSKGPNKGINVATKPFLALRIAVNTELENLEEVLPKAFDLLDKKGRLIVISFHSGEDRIVKNFYKQIKSDKKAEIINKKPIEASEVELIENPKSRSAKLRILEKI